jgi:hypothetical protein
MRQHRALLKRQGTSIVDLYWAGCIINMSGFDLRQAQLRSYTTYCKRGSHAPFSQQGRCAQPELWRRIFAERFDKTALLVRSRRTSRLDCIVHHLGLAESAERERLRHGRDMVSGFGSVDRSLTFSTYSKVSKKRASVCSFINDTIPRPPRARRCFRCLACSPSSSVGYHSRTS